MKSHGAEVAPAFVMEAEETVAAASTSKTDCRRVVAHMAMERLHCLADRLYALLVRLGHCV